MGFIYGLVDPGDSKIHYIGKASHYKRPLSHAYPNKLALDFTPKARWIRELKRNGLKYYVRVLQDGAESDLNDLEVWWIARGRAIGWPLKNQTDGGDGASGYRPPRALVEKVKKEWASGKRRISPEAIERMRHERTGVPRSKSTIEKIRQSCNKPDAIAKMRAANLEKTVSSETRSRQSAAHKGAIVTDEARAKMSKSRKAYLALHGVSKETREKIAASKIGKPRPDLVERNKTEAAKTHLARIQKMAVGRPRPDIAERNRLCALPKP